MTKKNLLTVNVHSETSNRGGLTVLGVFDKIKKEKPATPDTGNEAKSRLLTGNVVSELHSQLQTETGNEAKSRQHTACDALTRRLPQQYARKLNVNGVELYQLSTSNSRDDVIQECVKAEALMRQLGSEAVFRTRVDFLGIPRLDQVNFKEALVDYLWMLYDFIDERVAIQTNSIPFYSVEKLHKINNFRRQRK